MDLLLKAVGILGLSGLAIGGLVGLTYWLFKQYAAKWLDARFAEQLAALNHGHQKEIEHLRFEINAHFDRTVKLHQREFEVLPEAWAKLNDSYYHALSVTSLLQEYPAFDKMTEAQFEAFLNTCPLAEHQKLELRMSPNRLGYYTETIFWIRLSESRKRFGDVDAYVMKNGIFIPRELKDSFDKITETIWLALLECENNKREHDLRRDRIDQGKLHENGKQLMRELEAQVHRRVWSESLAGSST